MQSNDKAKARVTGVLYLLLAICGGAAFFTISETLHVTGDSSATFLNLTENAQSFRLSVTAWFITIIVDVFVAWLLFDLFARSAPKLAAVSIIFRLIYVSVHAAALVHLLSIVSLLDRQGADEVASQALGLIEMHSNGFMIALLFFGVHLILTGVLIARTGRVPRIIGIGLMLAGTAYIVDTVALSMLPAESDLFGSLNVFVTIAATLGEVSFLFWLLLFGIRKEKAGYGDNDAKPLGDLITR